MTAPLRSPQRTSRFQFRPSVEALEARDCPAAGYNMAPVITLQATELGQNIVALSGRVTDECPGGLMVKFVGVYNGCTVTQKDGSFALMVRVSGVGGIAAVTRDYFGQMSNYAVAPILSQPPTITNFQAVNTVDDYWVISGTVQDESPGGLIVYLNGMGLNNVAVQVQADGTFSYTVELGPNPDGMITAQTTDWFGLSSPIAEVYV